MATRYFKGTDGERTYFRASPTRVYRSLISQTTPYFGWTFSMHDRAPHPVVEITRQEYVALTALKVARCERIKAEWRSAHPGESDQHLGYIGTAPRDSWVRNDAIEGVSQ